MGIKLCNILIYIEKMSQGFIQSVHLGDVSFWYIFSILNAASVYQNSIL